MSFRRPVDGEWHLGAQQALIPELGTTMGRVRTHGGEGGSCCPSRCSSGQGVRNLLTYIQYILDEMGTHFDPNCKLF